MMVSQWRFVVALAVVGMLLAAGGNCVAEKAAGDAAVLQVGDSAPDWSNLVGTDDKRHGLSDYQDAKVVVLVFTCNHCPVAKAYEDRLIALQKDYKNKGVAVVAVNVNNIPADRLDQMKVRAEEKGFNFDYLYDPSQKIGHDYGAAVTPHIFVLDGKREVAYIGAIDDSTKPEGVKQHYLRDALDALLKGQTPELAQTTAVGCTIKYE